MPSKNLNVTHPTILILFGMTGDLAKRKIVPGLYHLFSGGLLPELFSVVGFSRRGLSENELKALLVQILAEHKDINPSQKELKNFLALFSYQQGDFTQQKDYIVLGSVLGNVDDNWNTCANKLFYLSVPPKYYSEIFTSLSASNLIKPCAAEDSWTRVIVEKPFGHNIQTAQALDAQLASLFDEKQIYRIDHFVAKEMMQNILAFRFANRFLERGWNNKSVSDINIYFPEKLEVKNRGGFYDGVGALRDVGQNHLLQILALLTMDDPKTFDGDAVRESRAKLLQDLIIPDLDYIQKHTVRGQYKGYTLIKGVAEDSKTETYFKIQAELKNDRWAGVPITLESGKALEERDLKAIVTFKPKNDCQNRIIFDLQGSDMGIYIEFWAKKPGLSLTLEKRTLSFSFCTQEYACGLSEPYERLILDCMRGNQTLFTSTSEIMSMWRFIDPIIDAWKLNRVPLLSYERGSCP